MSRKPQTRHGTRHGAKRTRLRPQDVPYNRPRIAEELGLEALNMAKWAHAAGLSGIAHLLENVALAAGAAAASMQWPADSADRLNPAGRVKAPRRH